MLRAYVMPLGQLTRPSWNNKITKIDGCGPRCPPAGRFVIDAVAISNDRPREPVDLKLTERIEVEVKKLLTKVDAKRDETEYRVVFNSPKLEVVDVMVRAYGFCLYLCLGIVVCNISCGATKSFKCSFAQHQ